MRVQACALLFAAIALGQYRAESPPRQITLANHPISVGDAESVVKHIVCSVNRCIDEYGPTIVYDLQSGTQLGGVVFSDRKVSTVWRVWFEATGPDAGKLAQSLFLSFAHLQAEWDSNIPIFVRRTELGRGDKVMPDHLKPLADLAGMVNERYRAGAEVPVLSIQTMSAELGRGKSLNLTVIAWDRSDKHLAAISVHEVLCATP